MKLHLVGGFLGSGKTTAIIQAAKALMAQGKVVGVITNDQGKYLVDTAFFRLSNVPTVEVTGGCFCCNYHDLDSRLAQLIQTTQPEIIFAESVGSCADIVATVVKPLLELQQTSATPSSFSVFTDARLLQRRLLGLEMPFSEDIVYIFDKQIEEAGLLVINKTDLLPPQQVQAIQAEMQALYPNLPVVCQSSLSTAGIQPWLETIQQTGLTLPATAIEVDYERYGKGEALLAWLDQTVHLDLAPGQGREAIRQLITTFRQACAARQAGIGHLKFIVESQAGSAKISLPTLDEPAWERQIPEVAGGAVTLSINARVEMAAEELKGLFLQVLETSGLRYSIQTQAAFHPGFPTPVYRFGR